MVLPKPSRESYAIRNHFLAENELITILPRYSIKKIDLIGVCIVFEI